MVRSSHNYIFKYLLVIIIGCLAMPGFAQTGTPYSGILTPNEVRNIDAIEYYFNIDPGFGKGTSIPISTGADIALNNIVVAGMDTLAPGIHNLFIRSRNIKGSWSVTNSTPLFVIKPNLGIEGNKLSNITKAEYFFDKDPGFGKGTSIPLSSGTDITLNNIIIGGIDTLAPGIHNFYIRTQDLDGSWSITNTTSLFVVKPNLGIQANHLSNISKAEYFFNTDPGFGKGTSIPLTTGSDISLNNIVIGGIDTLAPGIHNFYIRTQNLDGSWSVTNTTSLFVVKPNLGIQPNTVSIITKAEYFFDTDPGFGKGIDIPIGPGANVNLENVIISGIENLSDGIHNLFVRMQNERGEWSITNISSIYFSSAKYAIKPNPTLSDIVEIEYYIDSDPGYGNGIKVPVTPGTNIDNLAIQVDMTSIAVGDHKLYIRVKDDRGAWSIRVVEPFTVHLPVPKDIQVTAILLQDGECQLTAETNIQVKLLNGGDNPLSGFDIVYKINDSIMVTETISQEIVPAAELVYTFSQQANLSAQGAYKIQVYTLLADDDRPGNDTLTKTINHNAPIEKGVSPNKVICNAEQILLSAYGGVKYVWSTGSSSNTISVKPALTTTYFVTITDKNNCDRYDSVTVNVLPALQPPVISVAGDEEVCFGDTIVLQTDKGSSVEWFLVQDGENIPLTSSETYTATKRGQYFAKFSNASGCSINSELFQVNILPKPAITTIPSIAAICKGDSVTINIEHATVYNWSTGDVTSSIKVAPQDTTTYYVTGTNALGCAYSDSVTIAVLPAQAPASVGNLFPYDKSLDVDIPVEFSWSPAQNATAYDLYIWISNENKPVNPSVKGITDLSVKHSSGLQMGTSYKWMISSKNSCFQTESDIVTFTTGSLPDLIINSYQVTDNTTGGAEIAVEFEVKNIGAGGTKSGKWKDRIWLSVDKDLRKADDILIGEFDNLSYLQPGESYVQTKTVTIPEHIAGTYYLFIITDNDDAYCMGPLVNGECTKQRGKHTHTINESDEQNNFIYKVITINQPPLPDLVVKSAGAPADVFSNDEISVQYQVKNEGDFEAQSKLYSIIRCMGNATMREYYWQDVIYISSDPVFDINNAKKLKTSNIYLGYSDPVTCSYSTSILKVDSSYNHSATVKIPHEYQGTYYLYIVTNNVGVFESSYTNNIFRSDPINVRLTPPADLVVENITAPASGFSGEKISLDFEIKNQGANPPLRNGWKDKIYLSLEETFVESNAFLIGTKTYSGNSNLLTTGKTYTVNGEYQIPRGLLGSYYVYVYTDADDAVFEYNKETNNVGRSPNPVVITNGDRPDLLISDIVLPDTVTRGRQFPIKWTVKNSGTKEATGNWIDQVYWSSGRNFSEGSPKLLGQVSFVGTLFVSDTYSRTKTFTLPENLPDSVTFFVTTDYSDKVFEEIETNNTSSHHDFNVPTPIVITPPPAPIIPVNYIDLKASSIVANGTAMSGTNLSITYSVENLSSLSSKANWSDRIYLSLDNELGNSDHLLETISMSSIEGNGSYTKTFTAKIPNDLSGNYYLILYTDAHNTGRDTIRGNNIIATALNIGQTPPPDLFISAVTSPTEIYPGQDLMIPYTAGNQGVGVANGKWYDAVYLSRSPELSTSKILVGQRANFGPLQAGQDYTDSISVKIPSGVFGNYYLIVMTDYTNVVYEKDQEGNNSSASVVAVVIPQPADLLITQLTVPDTAYLGDHITTSYKVENIGANPTVGSFKDAVYVSSNTSFNPLADQLLGTMLRNNILQPGEVRSYNIDGNINSVFPGNYFGIGRTNITGSVVENNLNNNSVVSDQRMHVKIRDLQLGVPENTLVEKGNDKYYKIDVGADLDMVVELTSVLSGIQNEIYIAYGRVPTENDYDVKGNLAQKANQRIIIPGTQSGSYYLLAKSNRVGFQMVTLLARALPFSLNQATPNRIGKGVVSIRVEGAGFREGINFKLRKTGVSTDAASPTKINRENSMEAGLTWDLSTTDIGEYDLVAINPDASEVKLIKGITIEESTGYQLHYDVMAPEVLRVGKTGFYDFVIKNTGNVDIPFVQTSISVEDYANIIRTNTSGNVKTREQMNPGIDSAHFLEYFTFQDHKIIPLHSKDFVAGDEFRVSVLFEHFTRNTFPVSIGAEGMNKDEFMARQLSGIELMRNVALYNPDYFGSDELNRAAQDKFEFTQELLNTYIKMGVIAAADTIGINPCESCGVPNGNDPTVIYSPGESPGYLLMPYADFGKNQHYLWEINNYQGFPGSWNGWDLIQTQGIINITATTQQPFTVQMKSLDFFNRPGFLGGFAPAFDKCFPIAIANGGVTGFDAGKFVIDTSQFVRYNLTYGGVFSIKLHGTDTLMLCFTARKPGIGEDGIPGGPGGYGQPGAPGGEGGPGDVNTPAGKGGAGGTGGLGDGYRAPGAGGKGGSGGKNNDGSKENDGPNGPEGPELPEDFPPGDPPPGYPPPGNPPGTPPGTPPATPPPGGLPPGVPPGTPPPSPPGGGNPPGMDPGFPPPPPPPGFPPGGGPRPNQPPGPACSPPPFSAMSYLGCQAAPWALGCGLTAYGCYSLLISGGAKIGLVGGVAGFFVGATGGAIVAAIVCAKGIETCAEGNLTIPGKVLKFAICRPVVGSCDPNEIQGPQGYGAEKFVSNTEKLPYTILYENDPVFASAPAQRVSITQPIDEHLDASTLRLGSFGFGDFLFNVPEDVSNYTTRLHLADSLGFDVNVTAGLDIVNREIFWTFQAIDPLTGLSPNDPYAGYLPVNDSTGKGEGFVSYTIQALTNTNTGDSIKAKAEIVFDINAPIVTNTAVNIIDAVSPVSNITSQVTVAYNTVINLNVEASDDAGGSGVRDYVLYYSENNGPFVKYDSVFTDYSISIVGNPGSSYCFFTLSTDNVNNTELMKDKCELSLMLQPDGPLSVNWLYFTGEWKGNDAQLNWATASESNSKNFVIERSTDAIRFERMGVTDAQGNSDVKTSYTFTDKNAAFTPSAVIYYRLKQVDNDGKFVYSNVISLKVSKESFAPIVSVYPNPFEKVTTLLVTTSEPASSGDRVQLYSPSGVLLYERNISGRLNNAQIVLNDLPKLASGIYFLKTYINGKVKTMKVTHL